MKHVVGAGWVVLVVAGCMPEIELVDAGGSSGEAMPDATTDRASETGRPTSTDGTERPETTTGEDGSDTSAGEESSTGTSGELDCREGDICGEYSSCRCEYFFERHCDCISVECTQDDHCEDDDVCLRQENFEGYVSYGCLPPICDGPRELPSPVQLYDDADALELEGEVCITALAIYGEAAFSVAPLTSLQYVHETLSIDNPAFDDLTGLGGLAEAGGLWISNTALTDLSGLSGLQRLGEYGGTIRDNPSLPAVQIQAWLAGIDGGEYVYVCGNLDDVPCE